MFRSMTLTRLTVVGMRAPLERDPGDVGLAFEAATFPATDGVEIRGWFIPRAHGGDGANAAGARGTEPGPAVVFVHGWLWNRLGNVSGRVPFVDRDVDFLPATRALHDAGYHVLLIDLSNHGESGARVPITYGPWEVRDYQGALAYLRARPDVDPNRIGALGCSMGGNTVLYGTPDAQPVKALLAIQPARLPNFNRKFLTSEFGRFGPAMAWPLNILYALLRAPQPKRHDPAVPARRLGDTVVQYVQGTGDPWGTMADVEAFAEATPNALPVVRYPSAGRYEGYRYISEAADDVAAFFKDHL
jgi:dienelactone hydrolase